MTVESGGRVLVLGKGRLAVDCLGYLQESGAQVVGVVPDPSDDGTDSWQPSLKRVAYDAGLEVGGFSPDSSHLDRVWLAARAPDYLLSFQFGLILDAEMLRLPIRGALNLHFAPLPRYRGVAPIHWALRNHESEHGVTLHHIDSGVDSGDVVAIRRFPVANDTTARELYDISVREGTALFRSTWPSVVREEAPRQAQAERDALYYNRYSTSYEAVALDWTLDAAALAATARSLIFPPLQLPVVSLGSKELRVQRAYFDRNEHGSASGRVLELIDGWLVVAAAGGRVHLQVLPADLRRVPVSRGDTLSS